MEKISHILPASSRVTAVDLTNAQPVRPGAPNFTHPMASPRMPLEDRVSLSQQALESHASGQVPQREAPLTYKNSAESAKQKMIEKLSQDFFNPKVEARGTEMTSSEQVARSVADGDELAVAAAKAHLLSPQGNRVPPEN